MAVIKTASIWDMTEEIQHSLLDVFGEVEADSYEVSDYDFGYEVAYAINESWRPIGIEEGGAGGTRDTARKSSASKVETTVKFKDYAEYNPESVYGGQEKFTLSGSGLGARVRTGRAKISQPLGESCLEVGL